MRKMYGVISSCLLMLLLMVVGCLNLGQGTSQPSRFFVLNSLYGLDPETKPITTFGAGGIGLGPIALPDYLDRPQIVTRVSENEFRLASFSRWAEPLKANFERIFAENLAVLLSTDRIYFFPFPAGVTIDYQIEVQVARFDGMPGDHCELRVYWEILSPVSNETITRGQARLIKPSPEPELSALINIQSELMVEFSREIATALSAIESGN